MFRPQFLLLVRHAPDNFQLKYGNATSLGGKAGYRRKIYD
jgi:hypothetical protein